MIAESPPAGPLCREKEEAIVPLGLLKKEND